QPNAKVPERPNLVARLPGRGGGPSLLLLSPTETVVADRSEWQVDPWSGELRDGEVWGRGALDMKGEVAASAVAIASLAREGFEPAGDLIFVAAADEEVGDGYGLPWLCEEHPEAVRADYALNEGGGERIELAGRGRGASAGQGARSVRSGDARAAALADAVADDDLRLWAAQRDPVSLRGRGRLPLAARADAGAGRAAAARGSRRRRLRLRVDR